MNHPSSTGRDKIQSLTNAWYGATVFGALLSFLGNGPSVANLVGLGIGTTISLAIVFVIGRSLLNRSGFTRGLMVVLAALSLCIAGYGGYRMVVVESWTFAGLFMLGSVAITSMMNLHSIKVLTSRSANAYFGDSI